MTYKAVLIVGPNWPVTENMKKIYEATNCLIIGDGIQSITPDEITEKLQGNIDSNTRLDISGHGITIDGEHGVELAPGQVLRTSQILSTVSQCTESPTQVHLWSCFGGAAAKEASVLPKGSCLVAHAPEDSSAALAGLNTGLESGAIMHIARPSSETPSLNYQDVLDDLAIGAGQKSFFAVNTGKSKPIIIKDRLPDRMAQRLENGMPQYPATIHAAVQGHYKSAYDTITPALRDAQLSGVTLASKPERESPAIHETQQFYNERFSYQLALSPTTALNHAISNTSEMQQKANAEMSGLIATRIDWTNPILVEPLLASGFNPRAKITEVTPSSSSYNKSVFEHATREGGATAAIMLLKHDPTIIEFDVLHKTHNTRKVLSWALAHKKTEIVNNIVSSLDEKQQYKMLKKEIFAYYPDKDCIDLFLKKASSKQVNQLLNKAIEEEQGVGLLMSRAADFNKESVQRLVSDAMYARDQKTIDGLMPALDKFSTPQVQQLLDGAYRKRDSDRALSLLPRLNDFPTKKVQQLLTRAIDNDNQKMINGLMPRAANFTPRQIFTLSMKAIENDNKDRIQSLMPQIAKADIGIVEPILHQAVMSNNNQLLRNLLPRTNELSSKKVEHLMQGALHHNNIKVAKHLLPRANELSASIRKQTIDTIANHAIAKQDSKLMKACVAHVADLSSKQQLSIMSYAVNNDKPHTVKKLLLASTECNKERVTNQALYSAIAQGNVKTAQLLLQHPTNNNTKVLSQAMEILPTSLQNSTLHTAMQSARQALQPKQQSKSRSFVDRFRRNSARKTVSAASTARTSGRLQGKSSGYSR